ncbi:MAG: DinB family protein [Planctomycetaceae bacterium]|nr:DinB family protein [Planctomycetaceae bacterium]
MAEIARLELAIHQIRFAREYTLSLFEGIEESDWFRRPEDGGVSHLAWQMGHLAMAMYGLCLFRMRGRAEVDLDLMSSSFRKKFTKGTTPDFDPSGNPPISEIRSVFDRVYEQAMTELPGFTEEQLDEPIDMPYTAFPNKFGGLLFCSHHEMLHAGQIGLIRRSLGRMPVR